MRIYISYRRHDADFARKITHALRQILDASVWIDVDSIEAGEDWWEAKMTEMAKADVMVAVISPFAIESKYVKTEWRYFFADDKPIIPVLYGTNELPFPLKRMNAVDMRDQSDLTFEQGIEKICSIITGTDFRLSVDEAQAQSQKLEESIQQTAMRVGDLLQQPEFDVEAVLTDARRHHRNKAYDKAVESYVQVLQDRTRPQFRMQAVDSLTELRSANTVLLESLVHDPAPEVRLQIVKGLRYFHSPLVTETLEIAGIADDDLAVRVHSQMLVNFFRDPSHVPYWLDKLQRSNNADLNTVANDAYLLYNEMSETSGHVFISYSRRDAEDFTLELVDTLRQTHGYKIWMDTNLLPGSDSWKRGIAKAIEQCSLLLLILSPEVHNSYYIGEEVSYAEQLSKNRLFVKYKQTHMPFGMTTMQGLRDNLTFEDYPDEMLTGLIDEFERRNIPKTVGS